MQSFTWRAIAWLIGKEIKNIFNGLSYELVMNFNCSKHSKAVDVSEEVITAVLTALQREELKASDAGSQYRCGRVGRSRKVSFKFLHTLLVFRLSRYLPIHEIKIVTNILMGFKIGCQVGDFIFFFKITLCTWFFEKSY